MNTVEGKVTTMAKTVVTRAQIPTSWIPSEGEDYIQFEPVGETQFKLRIFKTAVVPKAYVVVTEDCVLQSVTAEVMMSESILSKYNIDILIAFICLMEKK